MAKNTMTNCKSCNAQISKKAKVCVNCGAKNKKPIYKRGWFIALVVVFIFILLGSFSGGGKYEKLDWNTFELASVLPEPDFTNKLKGEVHSNEEDYLYISIIDCTIENYKDYIDNCTSNGFDIDVEKTNSQYVAFNNDGYKLTLFHYESEEELSLMVEAPEEMSELSWPTSDFVAMIPVPKSTTGKIIADRSDYFSVKIANTTIADFNDYIEECKSAGFDVDYSKDEKYYSAENGSNFKVYIKYLGANVVEITLEELNKSEEKAEDKTNSEEELIDGLRPDFKEAMDSYEDVMNEYCVFMKKYNESNGNDPTLIADYANYAKKYADAVAAFEKWNEEEMNDAETAYYIKVQSRVNAKLLEVAY